MTTTVVSHDLRNRVIAALENPKYDWRTVGGVASEVGASKDDVAALLGAMPDIVVRASDDKGRTIFTTREHYERTHGLGDKLLSALADKVIA
ncbi:MAG: hypothetical protein ACLP6G_00485 [Terriglobales bacterium]